MPELLIILAGVCVLWDVIVEREGEDDCQEGCCNSGVKVRSRCLQRLLIELQSGLPVCSLGNRVLLIKSELACIIVESF